MGIKRATAPELIQRLYNEQVEGEIPPKFRRPKSPEHQLQGRQAQAAGGDFEGAVLTLCELYKAKRIARLCRMPVPTAPVGAQGGTKGCCYRVLSGQAPFDLYGYYIDGCRYIGAELKSTAKPEPSLPIIARGMKRGGLQEHQMDALASVAGCGGTARVVWSRAGEIGVLYEAEILAAQERFHEGGYASKSIKWDMFQVAEDWNWLGLTRKEKEK